MAKTLEELQDVLAEVHAVLAPYQLHNVEVIQLAAAILADATFQLAGENNWSEERMLKFGGAQYADSLAGIVAGVNAAGDAQ